MSWVVWDVFKFVVLRSREEKRREEKGDNHCSKHLFLDNTSFFEDCRAILARFGVILAALGGVWGGLGRVLAASWAALKASGRPMGQLGRF